MLQEGGSAGDMAAKLTTLENQLQSRSLELQELRAHLELIEDRHLQALDALTRNTDAIQEHLTRLIEQTVGATVESIRVRLQADIQETYSRTVNSIVETICDSMRQRLSAFETALAVNSRAMTQLCADSMTSQKAIESVLKKIEVPASRSTPDFPPRPNWISKQEQSLGPLKIAPARIRIPIWARQKAG